MIKARKGVNNNAAIITISALLILVGGERGIRTPELVTVNSFRDCRIQPLCHLSMMQIYLYRNRNSKICLR